MKQILTNINELKSYKEGHNIMIKQSVIWEYITILNTHAPNRSIKIHEVKNIQLQLEIEKHYSSWKL